MITDAQKRAKKNYYKRNSEKIIKYNETRRKEREQEYKNLSDFEQIDTIKDYWNRLRKGEK